MWYPGEDSDLIETSLTFFEVILENIAAEIEIIRLIELSGIDGDKVSSALFQKEDLDKTGFYPYLTDTLISEGNHNAYFCYYSCL
ncbi:hypothetical protein [Bacillus sp. NPDC094106]|uniref:hypothetical protein n=1 Tax=Bacillus sp. NPDC094106 TaxID=3363949 RepID=UPI0038211AC1